MVPQAESSKVLCKFYHDPYRDELSGDRNKLKEEPDFFKLHFFDHAPRVVIWNQGFPRRNACFFKHSVQADKNGDGSNNK